MLRCCDNYAPSFEGYTQRVHPIVSARPPNACYAMLYARGQNKVFKMSGRDGQPISKLVGHLLHLLGHATESMLVQLGVLVGCTRKPQKKVN